MDIHFTCIVVDISAFENYPFSRHHEPILPIDMHEVCVCVYSLTLSHNGNEHIIEEDTLQGSQYTPLPINHRSHTT